MDQDQPKPKQIRITDSGSLAKSLFWGAVILAGFVGVVFFAYQVKRQISPPEYEGKIIDKWAGYSHTDLGSFPYFRLLVETAGNQKSTVVVDQQTYDRAKVGMWIRKTAKGIELSSLTALPLDVRKRLKIKPTLHFGFAAGCEAAALPRRVAAKKIRGYAPFRGAARELEKTLTEGLSRFLTSGGEAVNEIDLRF